MRTSLAFTALVASLTAVIAVPVSDGFIGKKAINGPPTSTNTTTNGKDIILWFKTGDSAIEDSIKAALDYVKRSPEDDSVDVLRNSAFTAIIMKGVDPDDMDAFNAMDSIDVVEEDVTIRSFDQQSEAVWGLQRISNDAGASGNPQAQAFTYSFDGAAQNLGAGVDIYMVDTGIRTTHAVFQGRAVQGFPATGANDGDGHGTHTAGTAAGAKFGVAQGANLIAVKVLGDDGSGSSLDFIKGIDWAVNNHDTRKTQPGFVGSVMSMSLGIGTRVDTVNRAVAEAVNRGIHVSVAAGNEGKDACGTTPASLGGANSAVVTVGAININNQVSTFSNIGTCVDIYAPGEQILSAWNAGDKVINFLSGTSMACPHVTGVMATLIAQDPAGLGQNPAALKAKLLATARKNAFTGNTGGSANLLLSNGVNGNVAPQGQQQRRTVTGDITNWAKDNLFIKNLGARWTVHSTDSPMRF